METANTTTENPFAVNQIVKGAVGTFVILAFRFLPLENELYAQVAPIDKATGKVTGGEFALSVEMLKRYN